MVLRHWVAWKELEGPGRPWNDPRHRTYRGLRPINTAYLPTVDSVVENIVVVYRQSITTNVPVPAHQSQALGSLDLPTIWAFFNPLKGIFVTPPKTPVSEVLV
jgi:hypothetical protein